MTEDGDKKVVKDSGACTIKDLDLKENSQMEKFNKMRLDDLHSLLECTFDSFANVLVFVKMAICKNWISHNNLINLLTKINVKYVDDANFVDYFINNVTDNKLAQKTMKHLTMELIVKNLDHVKLSKMIIYSRRFSSFKEFEEEKCKYEDCILNMAVEEPTMYKILPTAKELSTNRPMVNSYLM